VRTEEEVVRVGTSATYAEDLEHVKELAVDVSDDGDRAADVHDIALFHQQLFRLCADGFYDQLIEQLFPVQTFDTFIEVDGCCVYSPSISP